MGCHGGIFAHKSTEINHPKGLFTEKKYRFCELNPDFL
jgi:hypothetical protein